MSEKVSEITGDVEVEDPLGLKECYVLFTVCLVFGVLFLLCIAMIVWQIMRREMSDSFI